MSHFHVQDNKLYIAGTAKSDEAKNKVWDQFKQTNPSWQDELICDITVDQQAAASAGAGYGPSSYHLRVLGPNIAALQAYFRLFSTAQKIINVAFYPSP